MGVSLLVVFLYGSLVWGILPIDWSISFEGHFYGALSGVFLAYFYRKQGPQKEIHHWEEDEEDEFSYVYDYKKEEGSSDTESK